MLSERLEQANAETRKRYLNAILVCVALLVTGGLVLLNITLFDALSKSETVSPPGSEQPVSEQLGSEQAPPAGTAPAADRAGNSEARETFKSLLRTFEEDFEGAVKATGFAAWDRDAQREILDSKKEAINTFAVGKYHQAIDLLESASQQARTGLQARDEAYRTAFETADRARRNDDYDTARLNITEALRLKPQAARALELQRAIRDLPVVLALMDDIRVARIENNPEREIDLINQVLALDPARTALKERSGILKQTIKEQRFAAHIARGMENVDRRNLKQAREHLAKATAIHKGRPEIRILSERITALGIELEVARLLMEAEKSATNDQWQKALALFGKAKDLQPANRKAVDGATLAQSISDSDQAATAFLSAPHRLSSANVAELARSTAAQGAAYTGFSPSLKSKLLELDGLIALYNTKVAVQVFSDGLTEVAVRGVGRVGKVKSKVIELKPGRYSFEGKRQGFKAVLVTVEVPPGGKNGASDAAVDVRIVCHEQI